MNADSAPYITALCEFIWIISLKFGLNPNIISPPSLSVIIHPPTNFVLNLLPFNAIIRALFYSTKLMRRSVVGGSI